MQIKLTTKELQQKYFTKADYYIASSSPIQEEVDLFLEAQGFDNFEGFEDSELGYVVFMHKV